MITLTIDDSPKNTTGIYFDVTAKYQLDAPATGSLNLAVSFPTNVQGIDILNRNDWDTSTVVYKPGDSLYYKDGSYKPATNFVLSANKVNFTGTENLSIKFRVYPLQSGNVALYYRGSLSNNGNIVISPTQSSQLDQQRWPVSVLQHAHDCSLSGDRKISFANIIWEVKGGYSMGPGGNNFSPDTQSVWVDSNGLHLRVRKFGATWYCAEVTSVSTVNYGSNVFYVRGAIDKMDPNLVFSTFLYADDTHEIDIEYSKWGDSSASENTQFVLQPYTIAGNLYRFPASLSDGTSTQYIDWEPNSVSFKSYNGYVTSFGNANLIKSWQYTGTNNPSYQNNLKYHINLWLVNAKPPINAQEFEVVLSDAKYITDVRLNKPDNDKDFTVEQNYPNPFNPSTTIKFAIRKDNQVTITVYNLLGERVSELMNSKLKAGAYSVKWNADASPSGVYLYAIQYGEKREVRKLLLLK